MKGSPNFQYMRRLRRPGRGGGTLSAKVGDGSSPK
jgi:hypothetical protein